MVEHRCLSHVIPWIKSQEYMNRPRRVLQVASLGFDFSVWEIILPFVTGGVLCIPSRGIHMVGKELRNKICENSIESLNFTPGNLATLDNEGLDSLNSLLIGGEAYSSELIKKWSFGRKYQNVYGPTETTIFATAAPFDEHIKETHIGRPITNVQVYILDKEMRPVPIGCEGELYIGGAGLTRGYLNRPELTAERYVANPFSDEGLRLYRSGDVVKYLPDGNIQFVGRIDDQVKIRGFRIELGEIQAKLNEHPFVENCVVIVYDSEIGKQLVAYVVLYRGKNIGKEELEKFLSEKLPYYMVPKTYVMLDALPLNRSGKVNKANLPSPDISLRSEEVILPRTDIEYYLVSIWEEILEQHPISIEDDFFTLGGHSLVASKVVTRVQNQFGVECPLRLLFEYPTVAGFASQIELLIENKEDASENILLPIPRVNPIPATPNQQRLWFMEQMHPESPLYTVGWLQYWEQKVDSTILIGALDKLNMRHESLRTTFKHDGESIFQVISSNSLYEYDEYDFSEYDNSEIELKVSKEVYTFWKKPFDLNKGPLLRLKMIQLPNEKHCLP